MFGINILGTGSYVPKIKVTNDDLSKIVETNDEWISTRTGIKTRYMNDGEATWFMGAEAAKKAIAAANIDPAEIGLIIDSTVSGDFFTPSVACLIQNEIGAVNSAAFDINAACSGFVYALDTAKRYLQTDESLKYVLVVANEMLSRITDFTDRSTCVLFGDGAGAVVIERSEKLYSSYTAADGTGGKFLYAKKEFAPHPFRTTEGIDYGADYTGAGQCLIQDGREVYKFAVRALPFAAERAAEKIGLDLESIDIFVPHQANIRIIEAAAKSMGASMDKFIVCLDTHGNTSSASMPTALDEAVRSGRIKRGDKLCLVGFGAGLTMGAVITEY